MVPNYYTLQQNNKNVCVCARTDSITNTYSWVFHGEADIAGTK
jgi:hypothetical protein